MVFDKDAFVQENWEYLSKLGRHISYSVRYKFTSAEYEDLFGYAMLGVAEALPNLNPSNKAWRVYLFNTCYHYTLAGALKMLGLSRNRTKEGTRLVGVAIQFFDTNSLIELADAATAGQVLEDYNILPDIILNDEQAFVLKCLDVSLERQVFERLIDKKDIRSITEELRISNYTVHLMIRHIELIYNLAIKDLPYQHLLTPPRNLPD